MPFDGRSGPLICTPHSVRGVLRGVKTVSRRVLRRPKHMAELCDRCWGSSVPHNDPDLVVEDGSPNVAGGVFGTVPYLRVPWCEHADVCGERIRSPYGRRGDRLWIRESCRELDDGTFAYRADCSDEEAPERGPWKNVRFVPKRSARTWLELLGVRVERLQQITPEDVVKEGVCQDGLGVWPVSTFATLWDALNGRREGARWEDDPWVWRLEFRRLEV